MLCLEKLSSRPAIITVIIDLTSQDYPGCFVQRIQTHCERKYGSNVTTDIIGCTVSVLGSLPSSARPLREWKCGLCTSAGTLPISNPLKTPVVVSSLVASLLLELQIEVDSHIKH